MNFRLEQIESMATYDSLRMIDMNAYLLIRADMNINELSEVDGEKMDLYWKQYYHEVHAHSWSDTKWRVISYPNASTAQRANMSTAKFEDLYFKVCNLDYSKLADEMKKLVNLMKRTDKVRIVGQDCDLSLSIKGMPVAMYAGLQNLPDGRYIVFQKNIQLMVIYRLIAPLCFKAVHLKTLSLHLKMAK